MTWAELETPLDEAPAFRVGGPDGKRGLSELTRVRMLRKRLRKVAPAVRLHAIPNAAKRGLKAQANAKAEGLVAGVFDLCLMWPGPGTAWLEVKGYTADGRAGRLSQAQIDWGNAAHRMGHQVACFFDPDSAISWLREIGAPIGGEALTRICRTQGFPAPRTARVSADADPELSRDISHAREAIR